MARGMAGHVDRTHLHAPQIPDSPVVITQCIRPRRVAELAHDLVMERIEHGGRVAIVGCKPSPAARGVEIAVMNMERHLLQHPQPRHVILMHMPQDHEVGAGEAGRLRKRLGDERRVEHRDRIAAVHDHLITVGILSGQLARPDGDRAELNRLLHHGSLVGVGTDLAADDSGRSRWAGIMSEMKPLVPSPGPPGPVDCRLMGGVASRLRGFGR